MASTRSRCSASSGWPSTMWSQRASVNTTIRPSALHTWASGTPATYSRAVTAMGRGERSQDHSRQSATAVDALRHVVLFQVTGDGMSRIIRDAHRHGWTDSAGSLRGRCGGGRGPGREGGGPGPRGVQGLGLAAARPRSRGRLRGARLPVAAPPQSSESDPDDLEDEIVALRKDLVDTGLDAGARTIAWHMAHRRNDVPSASTTCRVLSRRGFVEAQPAKRPHASLIRFEAALPNECWQGDVTHGRLRRLGMAGASRVM